MSPRKWSALSRIERNTYLAGRTEGDPNAAKRGPGALAEHVARREVRRAPFRGGAPVYLRLRRTAAPVEAGPSPRPGMLAAMVGLIVLIAGTIACAVTGQWAAMILVVIFGLGALLWAGRGGRDGLPKKKV